MTARKTYSKEFKLDPTASVVEQNIVEQKRNEIQDGVLRYWVDDSNRQKMTMAMLLEVIVS